jgi:hypothetical protein
LVGEQVFVDGKRIGEIIGDTFHKPVRWTVHHLRTPSGWAIDKASCDFTIFPKCKYIVVEDNETGKKYWCTVKLFREKMMEFNRGFKPQYVLTMDYWCKQKPIEQGVLAL